MSAQKRLQATARDGGSVDVAGVVIDHLDLWTGAITKKSTSGRGSNGKIELTGIKKLRELILELAVRGKLVEQNPTNEAAAQLLSKTKALREQLVKEGKLRRLKQAISAEDIEKPFEIPASWSWATLPDVASYSPGKTPSTKAPKFWATGTSGIPWVSIADLNHDGTVRDTTKAITQIAADEVFKSEPVAPGTILMSFKLTVGKVSITEVPVYHNEAIISIFPFNGVSRDYLFKVIPMLALGGNTKRAIMGNTLNATSLAQILVPLPPEEEQHRIVQKVDELMALCDRLEQQTSDQLEAHETLVDTLLGTLTQSENATELADNWARLAAHFDTLFTTEQSIDKLKQTILQLAVMGRLVEQDEVIPTDQQDTPSSPPEAEQLPDIPHSWNWFRLNDIADVVRGGSPRPAGDPRFYNGSIPFLKVGDITHLKGKYVTSYTYSIKEAGLKKTRFIENRTVLLSNSGATLGIPAICGFPTAFNDGIAAFINLSNDIFDEYLYLFLKSKSQWFLDFASRGQGQPNLNTDIIKSTLIPVPVLEEQHRIVQKVDELMALCDQLKESLNQASETCCQLAEAVVEGALN